MYELLEIWIQLSHEELSTSVVMGLAFRVDQIFKLGMKLALFLKLPDTRETLCIPQAYVSWINGRRFGVELRATRQEDHSGSSSNAWPSGVRGSVDSNTGIQPGGITMKQMKHLRRSETPYSSHSIERRKMRRTCASFGIMYSGINGEDVIIGDGVAVDLSEGGLGIRGNCRVKVGMQLTLFLYLMDEEEPLFVSETVVAWTAGSLFGVEVKEMTLPDCDRMLSFLRAQSVGQA